MRPQFITKVGHPIRGELDKMRSSAMTLQAGGSQSVWATVGRGTVSVALLIGVVVCTYLYTVRR